MRTELFFEFGDKRGEANFLAWHQVRHRTYNKVAGLASQTFSARDLTNKVTPDWLYRHYVHHLTLRRLISPKGNSYIVGLADVEWSDPAQVGVWLLRHALEHAAVDSFYGLH